MRRWQAFPVFIGTILFLSATTTRWRFTETPPENFYRFDSREIEISGGTAKLRGHTPWFNRFWIWRKPIILQFNPDPSEPPEFQTINNYIFRVQIDTSPIFDDFWNVVNSNGWDVRFAEEDGDALPFYRETFIYLPPASRLAVFWVKIPQLVPGTTRIYMYYNNPDAIDASENPLTFFADGVRCIDRTPGDPNDQPLCPAMKYFTVQLPAPSQYCEAPPNPNCPVPYTQIQIPPGGDEGNIQIAIGTSDTRHDFFFPFYGRAYNFLKFNINGCAHPYYDNPDTIPPEEIPIGLGGAGGGGDATHPYPCGWSSEFFTSSIIPYRLIFPYARDLAPVGSFPFYKMVLLSPNPQTVPHEFRIRWTAQLANLGGTNRGVLRLYSNGHMQFDYGTNSSSSLRKGARVGFSAGDEMNFAFLFPNVYDLANPSNARSLRIFAIQEGRPAPTLTIGEGEKFYSFKAPTLTNISPSPSYFSLLSFEEVLGGTNEGQVKYQLSPNSVDWYYVDTSLNPPQWVPAPAESPKFANTAAEVNDNLELFPGMAGLGRFYWKAFFISDGLQRVVLDELRVTYSLALTDVALFLDNQWKGVNIYNASGLKQTYLSTAQRGTIMSLPIQIFNKGNATDTFLLRGSGPAPNWDVRYFSAEIGGTDITSQVINGTYQVVLPPGQSRILRAEITPDPSLPAGSEFLLSVTSTSTNDSVVMDTAMARFVVESLIQVDGVIALLQDFSDRVGEGIIDPSGASQAKTRRVRNFTTAVYYLRFRNTGTIRQNTVLFSSSIVGFNWDVKIFDQLIGGNDITSRVFSTLGYPVALGIQEDAIFRVEVTPTERVLGGDFPLQLVFSLQQERERTTYDSVKAVTEIIPFYQPDIAYQEIGNPVLGEDVYSPDGSGQTWSRDLTPGGHTFFLPVENDGNLRDFLILQATLPPPGWSVRFFDAVEGGNDITASILGAGFSFTLNPFSRTTVRMELNAPSRFTSPYLLQLTLTSFNARQMQQDLKDVLIVNYQVISIFQPDLKISRTPTFDPAQFLGNDLYDPNQILSRSAGPGTPAIFYVMLENDGNTTDRFTLKGSSGNQDWEVRYFDAFSGGNEITSEVTGNGWITPLHEPGTFSVYRFEVNPRQALPRGSSYQATLQALSLTNLDKTDQVTGIGEITFGVDAAVCSRADLSDCVGQFLLDPSGELQRMSRSVRIDSVFTYYFAVSNPSVDDTFQVQVTESPEPAWEIHYFSAPTGGAEITSLITTIGWQTPPVPRGELFIIRAEVHPQSSVPPFSTKTITLSSRSISSFAEVDTVKAITTAIPEFIPIYGVDLTVSGRGAGERGAPDSGAGGAVSLTSGWQSRHSFPVVVNNIGRNPDRYILTWNTPQNWNVYLFDGTNIFSSGMFTPPMDPGSSKSYDLIVELPAGSTADLFTIFLNAFSLSDPQQTDSVAVQIRTLLPRYGIDLAVDNQGFGEVGPDGRGGFIRRSIPSISPSSFPISILNNGNLPSSYRIVWNTPPGWTVVLITPQPQPSGFVTPPVAPGSRLDYLLSIQPPPLVTHTRIVVTVNSTSDPGALDSVLLELSGAVTGANVFRGPRSPIGDVNTLPGTTNLPVLQVGIQANPMGFDIKIQEMTVRFQGSGNFSRDIAKVKIWADSDNNGIPDGVSPLAISTVSPTEPKATLRFSSPPTISTQSPSYFIITLDFASFITRNRYMPLPYLAVLLLFAVTSLRFRRGAGIFLLLVLFISVFLTCRGAAPTPEQITWSYQVMLSNASDIVAVDAQTGTLALVDFQDGGAPIQGAIARIRK
ncbi:MAG: DUF2341 domain-containing protein [bacterium JZ-2024 1]